MVINENLIKLRIKAEEAWALAETYQALYETALTKYYAAKSATYWGREIDEEI